MKGSEAILLGFMEGANNRYVIPVYQRKYDWKIDNCQQLYIWKTNRHRAGIHRNICVMDWWRSELYYFNESPKRILLQGELKCYRGPFWRWVNRRIWDQHYGWTQYNRKLWWDLIFCIWTASIMYLCISSKNWTKLRWQRHRTTLVWWRFFIAATNRPGAGLKF